MQDERSGTLYDRIGGDETLAPLVAAFYRRILADPELGPFFSDTSIEKLEHMQREFFAAALGGPVQYSGRALAEAHAGLGIKPRHLRRFLEHFMTTLTEDESGNEIDEDDRFEIYSRISTYADEITGTTSVDG